MPRPTLFSARYSQEERNEAIRALRKISIDEISVGLRLIAYMRQYKEAHPTELRTEDFIACLSLSYPNRDTLASYTRAIQKLGLKVGEDLEAQEQRLRLYAVTRGALRGESNPLGEKPGTCGLGHLVVLLRQRPGDELRDVVYRMVLAITVWTGCRASHIQNAQISLGRGGIQVQWGKRKIREAMRAKIFYPFGWSCKPPSDLLTLLQQGGWATEADSTILSWPSWFTALTDVASSLNGWIAKREKKLGLGTEERATSSSGRILLSIRLHELVMDDRLAASDFEVLMDHTVTTSRARYQVNQVLVIANKKHRKEDSGSPSVD